MSLIFLVYQIPFGVGTIAVHIVKKSLYSVISVKDFAPVSTLNPAAQHRITRIDVDAGNTTGPSIQIGHGLSAWNPRFRVRLISQHGRSLCLANTSPRLYTRKYA